MANNKSSSSAAAAVSRSASMASSDAGSNDGGGSNGGSIPTALPTHEAMRILLSPDGYYEYLGIPKPNNSSVDIMDAAVSGLKSSTNTNNNYKKNDSSSSSSIDLERVKKNYRRLSLKHHPDRRTGNAEAFRMLNRAKIVLSNSKLRREYDLLGLDLDDDAEDEEEEKVASTTTTTTQEDEDDEIVENDDDHNDEDDDDDDDDDDDNGQPQGKDGTINSNDINQDATNEGAHRRRRRRPTKSSATTKSNKGGASSEKHDANDRHTKSKTNSNSNSSNTNGGGSTGGGGSKTETVMGHLASASLAVVLQVVVRTGLMGVVSVLISRYTILTYPAIGALTFLSYRLYSSLKTTLSGSNVKMTWSIAKESFSPMVIAFGVYCMYRGRRYVMITTPDTADASIAEEVGVVGTATIATTYLEWSWTFWLGETTVMSSFLCNSFEKQTRGLIVGFSIFSLLLSLWLRGKFWRYGTLLGLEAFVAILIVIVFPIMEMILESIVEEKMKKVGEKIRAHDKRMKELLRKEAGAG